MKTALVLVALTSTAVAAPKDDYPHVPVIESGALLTAGHGSWDAKDGSAVPAGTTTSVGVALRAEGSLVGALLVRLLPEQLRVGDVFGFDLGFTVNSFGVVGRIVTGLGASYEINHTVGVGLRGYYDTKWDPANYKPGNGGTQKSVFYVEATGRYGRILGRARVTVEGSERGGFFGLTERGNHAFGLSVRAPVGRDNWMLAVDYDHLGTDTENRQGSNGGGTDLARAGLLYVF